MYVDSEFMLNFIVFQGYYGNTPCSGSFEVRFTGKFIVTFEIDDNGVNWNVDGRFPEIVCKDGPNGLSWSECNSAPQLRDPKTKK